MFTTPLAGLDLNFFSPLNSLKSFKRPTKVMYLISYVILLNNSGIKPEDVQEVYMGNVCTAGEGQAPTRQATLGAGRISSLTCLQWWI